MTATSSSSTPPERSARRTHWLQRSTASFADPQFRRVWLGAVLRALGQWMELVAVGWLVFDLTDSVFLTTAAWSAHLAPHMVVGPIAGAAADRLPRHYLLAGATIINAAVLIVLGVLVLTGVDNVALLMLLFAVSGTALTFDHTALYALAADVVGPERMANAVSLTSFAQRSVGAVGAIASGLLLDAVGAGGTFLPRHDPARARGGGLPQRAGRAP